MKQHELTETTIATIALPERIESVKAGLLGALLAGLMFGVVTLTNDLLALRVISLVSLRLDMNSLTLISGAIAALSGFLFGITYRYIIRQDQNPHLRSGAVLAFGLVRGLAIVEGRLEESIDLLLLVVLIAESLLLFAGVRVGLDWALFNGYVKPFGAVKVESTDPADTPSTSNLYSVKSSNSG